MDDFSPKSSMDPITYAVITGDISQGALPHHVAGRLGDLKTPDDYPTYGGQPSKGSSLIALVLSIAFLVVAVLSW